MESLESRYLLAGSGPPNVLSVTRLDANPTAATTVAFEVKFDEAVTGVDEGDFHVEVDGGIESAGVEGFSGSGDTYRVRVLAGTGDGTLKLNVLDDDSIRDLNRKKLGGNGSDNGAFNAGEFYTIDRTAPTVSSLTIDGPFATNATTAYYGVSFSEVVSGFGPEDILLSSSEGLTGVVPTSVSGSGADYQVEINTGTGEGTIVLNISTDDGIFDLAGNHFSSGAGIGPLRIDRTSPFVLNISRIDPEVTNASSVNYAVTFSEPVTGVGLDDFSLFVEGVTGASITDISGSGANYTVMVDTGSGDGTIRLDVPDTATVVDLASNILEAGFTDGALYAIDKTGPTILSIDRVGEAATQATEVQYVVNYSEPVAGVTADDFSVTNDPNIAISGLSVNGAAVTVSVSVDGFEGNVYLLAKGDASLTDLAGNQISSASVQSQQFHVDRTPPEVTGVELEQPTPGSDTTISFLVGFSEPVNFFGTPDLELVQTNLPQAAITSIDFVSGTRKRVHLSTGLGEGTVSINVLAGQTTQDLANLKIAVPSTNHVAYTVDTISPSVASISRLDPNPTGESSVEFEVVFGEAVVGVDLDDFELTTDVADAAITTVTGAGATYVVRADTGSTDGTLALTVPATASITDVVGNSLASGATSPSYAIDRTVPLVSSISRLDPSPTLSQTLRYEVVFTEAVSGVDATDFQIESSGVSGLNLASVSGNGTTYAVTVTHTGGEGSVGLNLVDDDSIVDRANNPLGGLQASNGNWVGDSYLVVPGTVSGVLWRDLDRDGIRDHNEPGLAGLTVYIDLNRNGRFDPGEPSTLSQADYTDTAEIDETGYYSITGQEADSTLISVDFGDRWSQSYPRAYSGGTGELTPIQTLDGTAVGNSRWYPERVAVSPDGNFIAVTSTVSPGDGLSVFRRDVVTGEMVPEHWYPSSGFSWFDRPQSLAYSPNHKFLFVYSWSSKRITNFSVDPSTGALTENGTYAIGPSWDDSGLRLELLVSPDSKHLYASSLHENTLKVFSIDQGRGNLTLIEEFADEIDGITTLAGARYMAIPPDGSQLYLSALYDDSLNVFDRDTTTGQLTLIQTLPDIHLPTDPVVSPDGSFIHLASRLPATVTTFSRSRSDGILTQISTLGLDSDPWRMSLAADGQSLHYASYLENKLGTISRDPATGDLTVEQVLRDRTGGTRLRGIKSPITSPDGAHAYAIAETDAIVIAFSRDQGTISFPPYDVMLPVDQEATFDFGLFDPYPEFTAAATGEPGPTSSTQFEVDVSFSEDVTGVDATDFTFSPATLSGFPSISVSAVTGGPAVYTVTVTGALGDGLVELQLVDDDTIVDALDLPLGGSGLGNGASDVITVDVDNVAPSLVSIVPDGGPVTSAGTLTFVVTFDESVTGVTAADFSLSTSGINGASIGDVSGSGASYHVAVATGSGDGELTLSLTDNDTIRDRIDLPLGGLGAGNGDGASVEVQVIKTGGISGTIWEDTNRDGLRDSGEFGVAGVTVYLDFNGNEQWDAATEPSQVTSNDDPETTGVNETGFYEFTQLDPGSYIIRFASDEYSKPGSTAAFVDVVANATVSEVDFGVADVAPEARRIAPVTPQVTDGVEVDFEVTFSKPVSGVDPSDFTVETVGSATGEVISVSGGGEDFVVTVTLTGGDGTLKLQLVDDDTITDGTGDPLGGVGTRAIAMESAAVTVEKENPSISRLDAAEELYTDAATVTFHAIFSEAVVGVDASDFVVIASGVSGATIASVQQNSATRFTIVVDTGTGDGALSVQLADDDSIVDIAGKALGGEGIGNGDFVSPDTYTIETDAGADPIRLELRFAQSVVPESDGPAAATATLTRNDEDLSAAVTVNLVSSDPSEISVPAQVVIPAGQASVTFDVEAVDDAIVDGTQTVTVTATEVVSGELTGDPSFGDSGTVLTTLRNNITYKDPEIAVQPDGKVLAIGRHPTLDDTWQVVRLSEDGTFDSGFGDGGIASTTFADRSFVRPTGIVLHTDFRVTVIGRGAGGSTLRWLLARYNADGSPDTTFDTDGVIQLTPPFGSSWANDGNLNPDGSMYLTGIKNPGDLFVAKILSDGALDESFGTGGAFVPGLVPNAVDAQADMAVHPDGGFVVTGTSTTDTGSERYYAAKFNSDGSVDTSFGTNGYQVIDFGLNYQRPDAVAVQPDGKVVLIGYVEPPSSNNSDWGLTRLNADGTLDTSFGIAGLVTLDHTGLSDHGHELVILPDGRILAVGAAFVSGEGRNRAMAIFHSDGSLDTSFADNGLFVDAPLAEVWEQTWDVKLTPNGKVVTYSGYVENYRVERFVLPTAARATDATIDVTDDDTLEITLRFTAATISEGGGAAATTGTVTRNNADLSAPLDVTLFNGDPSELSLPATVTIPAGQSSVVFHVDAVDDSVVDGMQSITVTASAVDYLDGTDSLHVTDDDTLELSLRFAVAEISEGDGAGATTATVTRNDEDLSAPLTVLLRNDEPTELAVPDQVVIPAGDASVTFPVDAVDDTVFDGTQTVTVIPAATGLDTSFGGGDGKIDSLANGTPVMALRADGKLLLTSLGSEAGETRITRYQADGSLDTTFGDSGSVTADIGFFPTAMALQTDGAIVLGGHVLANSDQDMAFARLLKDGSLDATFGTGGTVVITDPNQSDPVWNMALQSDGKIVAVGSSQGDLSVTRLNADGSVDTAFASSGRFVRDFEYSDTATDVMMQADGKIVVSGSARRGNFDSRIIVGRLLADGSTDTTFGTDGFVQTDLAGSYDGGQGVAVAADGKILVVGQSAEVSVFPPVYDLVVVRYNDDGSIDSTFGNAGVASNPTVGIDESGRRIGILADGAVVAAGLIDGLAGFQVFSADGDFIAQEGLPAPDRIFGGLVIASRHQVLISGDSTPGFVSRFTAGGYLSTGDSIDVTDDDARELALTFAVAEISEGDGTGATTATVTRNDADVSAPLTVRLTNEDATELSVPDQVVIPAGQSSVSFPVDAVDDEISDGAQTVAVIPTPLTTTTGLDTSFGGGDGRVDSLADGTPVMALRPDGKFLLASFGSVEGETRITRYQPDGSIDTTFGNSGSVNADLGFFPSAMALQADGAIALGGTVAVDVDRDLAFARLHEGGSLDTTFGTGGTVIMTDPNRFDRITNVALQADGKIIATGCYGDGYDFGVLRLNPDGSIDTTFASNGWFVRDFDLGDAATDVVLQADGTIVVSGYSRGGNFDSQIIVGRLLGDGSTDTTFGTDGFVQTDLAGRYDRGDGMAVAADGKILVIGQSAELDVFPPVYDLVVVRYNDDGSIDSTFGNAGVASNPTVGIDETGRRIGILADGQIIAAGLIDGLAGFQVFSADGDFLAQEGLPAPDRIFGGLAIASSNQVLISGDFTPGFVARFSVGGGAEYVSIGGSIDVTDDEEPYGEIRGTKWQDIDFDGIRDEGEPGLADWSIYLDTNGNGQFDADEPTTVTAADDPNTAEDETGTYAFIGLSPGTYRVGEVHQSGWQQNYPTALETAMQRVTVADDGSELNGIGALPSLSFDGRFVAFTSDATNVVAGITNTFGDVFVHDRLTGQVERVSTSNAGEEGNDHSNLSSISGDGRFVVFQSVASNLVAEDTNGVADIFVFDRQASTNPLRRISVANDGTQADAASETPRVSHDGRYVVFESDASNLVDNDNNGQRDIFLYDIETDEIELISVALGGASGAGPSQQSSVSGDGRYVAFASGATDLIGDDTNDRFDVYVRDRRTDTTKRISLAASGEEIEGPASAIVPMISGNGQYVAFASTSDQISPDDTNNIVDIFVYDDNTGLTTLVSRADDGTQGSGGSWEPAISYDGQKIAFYSYASNLVAGDGNAAPDVFLFDLPTTTLRRMSVADDGTEPELGVLAWVPAISGDGKVVGFSSESPDLVPGDTNALLDAFVATISESGNGFHTVSVDAGQVLDNIDFGNAVDAKASVVEGRHIFYNNSTFDGNGSTVEAADAAAIATDKSALLPGETATFANYTSYSRGINGVMVDIADLPGSVTAGDFEFRVGNDDDPSGAGWADAPEPTAVTVLHGEGVGGSDRVVITWADGDIAKAWLQVTVKANANTGLVADDVHYWGNWVGETGNSADNTVVNTFDQLLTRINFTSSDSNAAVDSVYDFNRDGKVNTFDQLLARINFTSSTEFLNLISAPASAVVPASLETEERLEQYATNVDSLLADDDEEGIWGWH